MLNTRRFPSEGPHSDAPGSGSYRHELELASRYQAAAAELGQIALESTTLDTLYKIVATRLGQLLGVDRVAIMEVEEDRRLVLKAGTGWAPGQTGCVIAEWDASTPHAYPPVLRGPIVDEWLGTPPRPQVGSSRVDLQACKLEYSIVSPK